MANLMKRFFQSLWGTPAEQEIVIAPPIDCAACTQARLAGKDACADHHSHHRKSARGEDLQH